MLTQKLLSISLIGTEWILFVLLLMSIVSWAIIIERYFYLRRKSGNPKFLLDKIRQFNNQGKSDQILPVLKNDGSSASHIAVQYLAHAPKTDSDKEEVMGVVLSQEKLMLESRIIYLGTIVSIAPFVGLLGTVLGIINAFHGLSMKKQGGDLVMAGISEALIATALGLFIAIPAAVMYNYFVRTIKKILVSSENFTRILLINRLFETQSKDKYAVTR